MLTAVVLTKNEEKNIEECLQSLSFCDEVIVIDDGSTDKTVAIAKAFGVNIFHRLLNGDFSAQRNFGLEKAKGEWALFMDADERIPSSLRDEIIQSTNQQINKYDGYYVKRRDFMWRRKLMHGETGSMKLLRLARRDAGAWEGKVHEIWKIQGPTGELQNTLLHYPHQSMAKFLEEINHYTDVRVKELYEKGIKTYWWSIILYPKAKFFVNYFLRRGFLDGTPGFVHAILMSFHSFLVRGKLWLLWQKR